MAHMAIPVNRYLATIRSQTGFRYRITRDDVLWMARMAVYEGGDAADSLWALTQRYVWFEERGTYYARLADLAQAFSQPINPRWTAEGDFCAPGGKYHGTDYCSPARLARRQAAREASLDYLADKDPDSVARTVAWAQGMLPNPLPLATNWAAPKVAQGYLDRNPDADLLLKRGNWFIVDKGAQSWAPDHVFIESPAGRIADASGVYTPGPLKSFARGAVEGLTSWWRLT